MSATGTLRKERVHLRLAIEALGTDSEGQQFTASARTVEIHRDGAIVLLPAAAGQLAPGQTITLRRRHREGGWSEGRARVVNRTGTHEGSPLYGVRLLEPEAGFWAIEFPETADYERAVACMLLECCFCRRREVAYVNEHEMICFNAQKGIARICAACDIPTIWVQTLDDYTESSASAGRPVTTAENPAGLQRIGLPAQQHERQEAPRFRTRLSAAVRAAGCEEELAVCENMSRGGLCFRTRRAYNEDSIVEVAVPYTKGAVNIFVPVRVVYMQEVPAAKLFRHGAAYIRMTVEEEEE
jgi:hypothetical protein